ncbi:cuticle protein 19-like [Anopheles maculipalpis]|uniref:cuticle protein 19-like n=1 Tax=Anopheles maculipalpis TaxID=1496333 RepID=UPI0021591273|nr:cuticle protein 19-like [Anopheles maculipalpis]
MRLEQNHHSLFVYLSKTTNLNQQNVQVFQLFLALVVLSAAVLAVDDFHAYPSYKFEYGVKDPHTGDHKSQWEHRDGDVVKGAYTLHEADGTERVVEYSSDKHNGFQAHVKRVGHAHHPEVYGQQAGYGGSYGHGYGHSYSKLSKIN